MVLIDTHDTLLKKIQYAIDTEVAEEWSYAGDHDLLCRTNVAGVSGFVPPSTEMRSFLAWYLLRELHSRLLPTLAPMPASRSFCSGTHMIGSTPSKPQRVFANTTMDRSPYTVAGHSRIRNDSDSPRRYRCPILAEPQGGATVRLDSPSERHTSSCRHRNDLQAAPLRRRLYSTVTATSYWHQHQKTEISTMTLGQHASTNRHHISRLHVLAAAHYLHPLLSHLSSGSPCEKAICGCCGTAECVCRY